MCTLPSSGIISFGEQLTLQIVDGNEAFQFISIGSVGVDHLFTKYSNVNHFHMNGAWAPG